MTKIKNFMILMLFFLALGNAHSNMSDACEAKKDKLTKLLKKCKALKGQSGYNKCAANFKKQKAAYKQGCSNVGADASVMQQIDAFQKYENDVCKKKDYKGSRCAVSVRNLGKLFYQQNKMAIL